MRVTAQSVQLQFSPVGWAGIAMLGNEHLVISDWSGHLTLVHAESGRIEKHADVQRRMKLSNLGLGTTLSSLVAATGDRRRCAVASRFPWACVWTPDEDRIDLIDSVSGNQVNCVALSEDGSEMLIGTGWYPLDGRSGESVIEHWVLDPVPTCLAQQRLIGTAVDGIDWNEATDTVAVAMGAACQTRGYLALLQADDLRIRDIFETELSFVSCLRVSPWGDTLSVVHSSGVYRYELPDLRVAAQTVSLPGGSYQCAINPSGDLVLLTEGTLSPREATDGKVHRVSVYDETLDDALELPDSGDVAALCFGAGETAFGLTGAGVLRKWRWEEE